LGLTFTGTNIDVYHQGCPPILHSSIPPGLLKVIQEGAGAIPSEASFDDIHKENSKFLVACVIPSDSFGRMFIEFINA